MALSGNYAGSANEKILTSTGLGHLIGKFKTELDKALSADRYLESISQSGDVWTFHWNTAAGKSDVTMDLSKYIDDLKTATTTTLGGIKVAKVLTTAAPTLLTDSTTNRYYGVQIDNTGKAFVNVPWTDTTTANTWRPIKVGSTTLSNNTTTLTVEAGYGIDVDLTSAGTLTISNTYTLPKASTTSLGGIIASNVLTTAVTLTSTNGATTDRYYGVQVDKDGKAFVNVPWTDTDTNTTYNAANTTTLGLVKLTSTSTITTTAATAVTTGTVGRVYPVQFNGSQQLVVNVPWTDNNDNTTYEFATGTTKSGSISVKPSNGSAVEYVVKDWDKVASLETEVSTLKGTINAYETRIAALESALAQIMSTTNVDTIWTNNFK